MKRLSLILLGLLCPLQLAHGAEKSLSPELDSFLNTVTTKVDFVDFDKSSRKQVDDSAAITTFDFAGENFEHADGIYGSHKVRLQQFRGSLNSVGFRIYSTTKYKALSPEIRLLTSTETLKRATALRDKLYPNFVEGAYSGSEPRTTLDRGFDCTYIWRVFDETGTFHRIAALTIRKIDGKCTSYSIEEGNFDLKIKAAAALKIAKVAVEKDSRFGAVKLRDWWLHDNNLYFVQYDAIVDEKPKVVAIEVNSETGKVRKIINDEYFEFEPINWDYYMSMRRGNFDPHWSHQGVVYLSYEFPQSFGEDKVLQGFHPKLMLHDTKGNDWVLYSSFDQAPELSIVFANKGSDKVAFAYKDQKGLYILNLVDGTVKSAKPNDTIDVTTELNDDKVPALITSRNQNQTNQIYEFQPKSFRSKQITPNEERPAQYYRFPSGKTGYDVSKEIALDQLKRESLD